MKRGWERRGGCGAIGLGLASVLALAPACYSGASDGDGEDAGEGDDDDDDDDDADDDDDDADDDDDDDDDDVPAGCENEPPPRTALRRMDRSTYIAALRDVFGADAVEQVQLSVDALPSTHAGVFSVETTAPSYAEVAANLDIAAQLAYTLTIDDAALAALRPCLPDVQSSADPTSDACLAGLLDDLGRRLLRRPLTDEDRTRLAGDYEVGSAHSVDEGVATLIIALLIDPEFLYYAETAGEEVEDGVLELTSHELAARLARVLWRSIPDEELLDVAEAGLDDEALAEQVDRMLDDPRARDAVAAFYRDWLELAALPFPAESLFPDADVRAELKDAMEAELLALTLRVTLEDDGTYEDLLLDRGALVESPHLATLYGVEASSEPTQLPADQRAGLLTRAAFLTTNEIRGTNAGHLIKRGNKLSNLLCRPLPLPDPDNFPQEDPADPESDPNQGIRERFADATTEPMCASCHVQLDGLGAPLGNYGSVGQWIDLETIELESGETNDLPIDTQSEVELDASLEPVGSALELSAQLAASRTGPQCLAQHMMRSIVARPLEPGDACTVEEATQVLAPDDGDAGSLADAWVRLVTSDNFRRVSIQ